MSVFGVVNLSHWSADSVTNGRGSPQIPAHLNGGYFFGDEVLAFGSRLTGALLGKSSTCSGLGVQESEREEEQERQTHRNMANNVSEIDGFGEREGGREVDAHENGKEF